MSSPVVEAKEKTANNGHNAPPELVPVKASVFDDDFFRASSSRAEIVSERNGMEGGLPERFREPTHLSAPARGKEEEIRSKSEEVFPAEASVRAPLVGSTVAVAVNLAEPDELDIPAFLRRGN